MARGLLPAPPARVLTSLEWQPETCNVCDLPFPLQIFLLSRHVYLQRLYAADSRAFANVLMSTMEAERPLDDFGMDFSPEQPRKLLEAWKAVNVILSESRVFMNFRIILKLLVNASI